MSLRVDFRAAARGILALSTGVTVLALSACTPDKALDLATQGPQGPAKAATASDAGVASAPPQFGPKVEFAESDFVESDRNRDPFRSYVQTFVPETAKRAAQNQHNVVLAEYAIEELKLVAIVMGGEYPRAMVLDPNNKGWVLKRGDYVGRPEIVHVGGAQGTDYPLTWRVDKVRDGEIVFLREDPAQPGIAPAFRVVALRPEGELGRERAVN